MYSILKTVSEIIGDILTDTYAAERKDPISAMQLHFIKSILLLASDERTKGMKGGLMKEKLFAGAQAADFENFGRDCLKYRYMVDFEGTVKQCNNLSMLWFKEFYLELSRQVQFPISTSLPWIITEFALDSDRSEILQYFCF